MSREDDFFRDGSVYDRAMGRISSVAGRTFLDWLSQPGGLRWVDVGCGTGSFSELVRDRSAPRAVTAVDPSEAQLAIAKSKPGAIDIDYRQGDAMSLPFSDDAFDVAVMALVVQYLPDPATGMAEIVRVVRPGGTVAAYVWPGQTERHPFQPLAEAVRSVGGPGTDRPGNRMRTLAALVDLFAASGLAAIESDALEIPLEFDDFDDYWSAQAPQYFRDLGPDEVAQVKAVLRERLPAGADGRISYLARANAVKGRVRR